MDSESVGLAITEQMSICRSVIDRLLALQMYDTACLEPIRAPITLIRPKLSAVKYNISEDYGLNKVRIAKCVAVRFFKILIFADYEKQR